MPVLQGLTSLPYLLLPEFDRRARIARTARAEYHQSLQKSQISSHESDVFSNHKDILAVLFRNLDGFEAIVGRQEGYLFLVTPPGILSVLYPPAFESALSIDEDSGDFSILDGVLPPDDHVIAIEDSSVDHAVAIDAQREDLAAFHEHVGVDGDGLFGFGKRLRRSFAVEASLAKSIGGKGFRIAFEGPAGRNGAQEGHPARR